MAKKPKNKPVAARLARTGKVSTDTITTQRGAFCAVDLLGNRIFDPIVPARQSELFDKADFVRIHWGIPTVVCRENGEKASGGISAANRKRQYTFVERETGKTYIIPVRCCTMTWAGDIAVISITDEELSRRTSLWGMFASCCLF